MDFLIGLTAIISLAVSGRTNATPSVAADRPFVAIVWSASDSAGGTDIYVEAVAAAGATVDDVRGVFPVLDGATSGRGRSSTTEASGRKPHRS